MSEVAALGWAVRENIALEERIEEKFLHSSAQALENEEDH